ncbi:hypothetical protein C7Y69_16150 [Alteromonas sp. KS69]|jgi:threonine/homoserine/homoserine lactone efflux protein|nr:MmpL4 protein [Glaciecola sp. 4H-3-7+YE-5]RUP77334.1 hypothetical protein C7Y69_16150 [Alteromonas sp. KS69]
MSIQNITKHLTNPLILIFYSVLGSPASYAHPGHQGDHSLLLVALLSVTVLVAVGLFVYRARVRSDAIRVPQ